MIPSSLSIEFEELSSVLRMKGLKLSSAESCTGGLFSYLVTSFPGSSEYFLGSAVTYSNESKESILGVSVDTLKAHGAVSEETAKEMAAGSLKQYCSDIAVSVTGIAGPGGSTEEKPVGLVCIAVTDGEKYITSVNRFPGDRDEVRTASVQAMVRDLRCFISEVLS